MSICVAGSKVYVATSPDLWVYEDKDGDLKADGPPQKLLTGFGGHNHDHGAHSLVLGPDHKWWMSHGDAVSTSAAPTARTSTTSGGPCSAASSTAASWRSLPATSAIRTSCASARSAKSFAATTTTTAMRACGSAGSSKEATTAGSVARQNACRRGYPYSAGWHFRGHQPGYVPGTLVTGFGSPCGICFYEGDALRQTLRERTAACRRRSARGANLSARARRLRHEGHQQGVAS